jgi:tRNA nucleotidyltransferase (CCA-adding enzyme)
VCEADKRGRAGHADDDYPQAAGLQRLLAAALSVRAADLADRNLQGPALGDALRRARIAAIHDARKASPGSA